MIDFVIDEAEKNGVLKIEGALAVEEAEAFKTAIQMAVDRAPHLVIDLGGLTEISLACLQILCSAHKTASRKNKTVVLENNIPEVFFKASESAGLVRSKNCDRGANRENCFWVKGGTS